MKLRAPGSGDRGAIPSGRDPALPDEGASHVALVGEARQQRGLGWRSAVMKESTNQPHSALDQIGVRGGPDIAHEPAQQLEFAHTGQRRQLRE